MVKVSIEVHDGTARFAVAVLAKSIQQALRIVAARYPGSVARVKFPINPEGFALRILLLDGDWLSLLCTSRN
jgi:hypothetical protein